MCQSIMELSNALIYGDRLRCGSPEVANAKLKFPRPNSACSSWLKAVSSDRFMGVRDGSRSSKILKFCMLYVKF